MSSDQFDSPRAYPEAKPPIADSPQDHGADSFWGGIIKSMGLVFGDVGTSPIYTLTVVFALTEPSAENVFGILSLVFWTMTLLVSGQYAWIVRRISESCLSPTDAFDRLTS